MRVLLVSWEYPPVIEGGLGRHVYKLSTSLAAAGHEVHVLTRGAELQVPYANEQEFGDVHVHRVEIPPFSPELDAFMVWVDELNDRLSARGMEVLASHGSFDLIHSHDWMVAGAAEELATAAGVSPSMTTSPPSRPSVTTLVTTSVTTLVTTSVTTPVTTSRRTPWLVTVHATEFGRHSGWVHTHPQREIHLTERHMVRSADHVICCSEFMAGHVRRVFGVPEGQVSAIPNGIDPVDLEPEFGTDLAALRRRYAKPDDLLVLLVGRLVYEKGFHVALDALEPLIAANSHIRFVIAGTGTAEDDLHDQVAKLGLTEHGRFLGRVNDDVLHALYGVADVAVVPSLYEPFGIVPLEAMVSGCPVVVSDTGGLREVVDDDRAGVRVPPGDAKALSAALAALLSDPARRAAMREAGFAHARGFDWQAVAGQTEGVYAELISSARPLGV